MRFNSKDHIQSLDGLRGIAILLVFFFHFVPQDRNDPLAVASRLGWTGVDLFFVLSGFLITGILVDTRESANRFKSFYARRALRILPVYFLAIALVIIGTHFLRGLRNWADIPIFFYGSNLVAAVSNQRLLFPPYFNCAHFWSLALEEQFYTIWPLVVFLIPRRQTLIRVCAFGILAALLFRVTVASFGMSLWVTYYELPMRMDTLLEGGLLALLVRGPEFQTWLSKRRLMLAFWAGCAALAPVIVITKSIWLSGPVNPDMLGAGKALAMDLGFSFIAIIFASMVGLSLIPGTAWNRIGSIRSLRFFGKYSYGLYVWHGLFSLVAIEWVDGFRKVIHPRYLADLLFCLCMLGLFTAISVLSYTQFEVRFLRLKSRFEATPGTSDLAVAVPRTS